MKRPAQWLADIHHGRWSRLADAARSELPVPAAFLVFPDTPEREIRAAYEELRMRERIHYVAIRAPNGAILDVLGPDQVMHTIRRLWAETPEAELLVQRMVNPSWSGKAAIDGKSLRIKANEGMVVLDPDNYLFNMESGKCTRRTLHQRPRRMFRAVDGRTRTAEVIGERRPLDVKHLAAIADLTKRAGTDIGWALDDGKVWLITCSGVLL